MPLDVEIAAAVLAVGMFEKLSEYEWRRVLPEEGTSVSASFHDGALSISINPAVSTFAGHLNKRHAAGVMLEIAAKYAEKVGGTITQHAEVVGCKQGETNEHVVGIYPGTPLQFSALCAGWQATFTNQDQGVET